MSKQERLNEEELRKVFGGQDSMLEAICGQFIEAAKGWKEGVANVKADFSKMFSDFFIEQEAKYPGFKNELIQLINKFDDSSISKDETWLLVQEFMNKYLA